MRSHRTSVETQAFAKAWYEAQYQTGYEEGKAGQEYSGRTWYGYYGFLDGKADAAKVEEIPS